MAGHPYPPHTSFDGGDLDCGNGLLLLIRKHIDPLDRGQLLEIRSTEPSVVEDLPAWCRLTGNELVSLIRGEPNSFLVAKGAFDPATAAGPCPLHRKEGGAADGSKPGQEQSASSRDSCVGRPEEARRAGF